MLFPIIISLVPFLFCIVIYSLILFVHPLIFLDVSTVTHLHRKNNIWIEWLLYNFLLSEYRRASSGETFQQTCIIRCLG